MGIKNEDIFRFAGQNAARLPLDGRQSKSRKFVSTIREYDIDGFCLQEIGIDWDDIDTRDQWHHRTDGKLQEQSTFAHNKHERGENGMQFGGTGVIVMDDLCFSIKKSGKDPSGLGRWCWTKFQRKEYVTYHVANLEDDVTQNGNQPFSWAGSGCCDTAPTLVKHSCV